MGTNVSIGIRNTGTIDLGNGKDTVDALTGGFAGGGTVYLGNGKDRILGFGEQFVDGGQGMDTSELAISYNQDLLTLGSSFDTKIGEMEFVNVEQFVFTGDQTFSLAQLQEQAMM